jgi:hypothetical protein
MLMKELNFLFFIKFWCINAVSRFFDSTVATPSMDPLESGFDMTKVQILRGVLDTVLTWGESVFFEFWFCMASNDPSFF